MTDPIEEYRTYEIRRDSEGYYCADARAHGLPTLSAIRAAIDAVVELLPLWCPVTRRIIEEGKS